MDIFLQDPADIPQPPDEVRIRVLRAEPYSDQRRVRIILEITPFQQRPNCEIRVMDEDENLVASLSIIESIDAKMDFTVHLQVEKLTGEFIASADIYYYEDENPLEAPDSKTERETHQLPNRVKIVDHRKTTFMIGEQQNHS
jgi:hypothetical protein